MYDFSNESHLLSSISQGYVSWAGNVMVRNTSSIPELVATQPEEDIRMQRKTSLQNTETHKVRLAIRPTTAKARLETVSAVRDNIRVVIGDRPMSSCSSQTEAKSLVKKLAPGKPDLTPCKEKFEVLPSYRPQLFPAKTYLTRQGNLMLYAVRDQRQEQFPSEIYSAENTRPRSRPISAVVKQKKTSVGERSLTKGQEVNSKDARPKSAPPSKAPPEDQSVENGGSSKNSNKTDAEILAELRAEMGSEKKKKNRPVSARKKSAKKRRKGSANVARERHNSQTDTPCEDTILGEDEVSSGMDLMRIEGRGGETKLSPRVDPRKARMRELAEKRRLEMEALRNRMRSELTINSEVPVSDNELDALLIPDSSSSVLEYDLTEEELETVPSTHSLVSHDSSLNDLLANRLAEQNRLEGLEIERLAQERRKREEERLRLEREAELAREIEQARLLAETEKKLLEEQKRQKVLDEWLAYQDELKQERFEALSRAYWRANSCNGISRAYTFSYFQEARLNTAKESK